MKSKMMKSMMKHTISCKEVEEFLLDYLEGRLGIWTRLMFKLHLMMCPDCPKYIEEYKNIIALGRKAFPEPEKPAKEKVPDEILQAILSVRKK